MADVDPQLAADNPEGADDGRPDWLPENFDSPEALVQSYKEAQRKITETAQEKRQIEENYYTLAQQYEEAQTAPRADPSDLRAQLYQRYEDDPLDTVVQLANQIVDSKLQAVQQQSQQQLQPVSAAAENMAAYQAWNGLQQVNPDIANYSDKIGEFLQENPYYIPQEARTDPGRLAQSLDHVYKIVSADARVTAASQEAEQAALMKMQAQSMSGSTGRLAPTPAEEQEWEAVKRAAKSGFSS